MSLLPFTQARRVHPLLTVMATVAHGRVLSFFTAAKERFLRFCGVKFQRRDISSGVRPIAKRLFSALAASAPVIRFTALYFYRIRRVSGSNWCTHILILTL
jgi:hypothetical protein